MLVALPVDGHFDAFFRRHVRHGWFHRSNVAVRRQQRV
jgi:hypothetical protein